MSEDIDLDHYSKILREQARNESDKIREIKRKIEDNSAIKDELTEEEYEIVISALSHEIEDLETMAGKSKEFLEEKIDAADQD